LAKRFGSTPNGLAVTATHETRLQNASFVPVRQIELMRVAKSLKSGSEAKLPCGFGGGVIRIGSTRGILAGMGFENEVSRNLRRLYERI
jgi:hypothetical protein